MLGGPAPEEYLGGPKCLGGPNFNGGTSNPCRNPEFFWICNSVEAGPIESLPLVVSSQRQLRSGFLLSVRR